MPPAATPRNPVWPGLLALAGLLAWLALPCGVESPLDGLPWSRRTEVWLTMGLLPWLALLGWRVLARPWALAAVAALLLLKLPLAIWAPASGWEARIYASAQDQAQGRQQATWEGFWRPGRGAALDKPWQKGREFPVEWLNGRPFPPDRNFELWVDLSGQACLPPGAGLVIQAEGLAKPPELEARTSGGLRLAVPVVDDPSQAARLDPAGLPRGNLAVSGRLTYGRGNWSLVPLLVHAGGRVEPAFKRGALWSDPALAARPACPHWIWRILARAGELGLALFLAAWGWSAGRELRRRGLLDARLAGIALLAGLTPFLLLRLGWGPDAAWRSGSGVVLGLGLMLADAGLRPGLWRERLDGLGLAVLLVAGPGLVGAFLTGWDSHLGTMELFALGDDWTSYQNAARDIFLGGDWLDRARRVWHLQPLYRYVVGGLHALTGQSTLGQDMLDVWSGLGAAGLTAALAARLGLGPVWALLAALMFALPEFWGPFRHHLGRGLQEHAATLAMLLAAWTVLRLARGWGWALAAGLAAAVGYWLRQDHLGVLAGLAGLALEPVAGPWLAAWRDWLGRAWAARWRLTAYLAILGAAVALVGWRNWIMGGMFTLTAPGNMSFLTGMGPADVSTNLHRLLLASEGAPDWAALVLAPGMLVGLLALAWRPAWLRDYPLSLGLSLAGLLAPYFLVRVSAYTPRFSLHLLPLAALSLAVAARGAAAVLRRPSPGSDASRAKGAR